LQLEQTTSFHVVLLLSLILYSTRSKSPAWEWFLFVLGEGQAVLSWTVRVAVALADALA
jgi:hypothetical protein